MGSHPAHKLPHTLNGVQFRAVRWKIIHLEPVLAFYAPPLMELCMMIARIIGNHLNPSSGMAAYGAQVPDKDKETLGIELLGSMEHELPIPQPYGSEIADALASRMMIDHGIFNLGWNPHAAP